MNWCNILEDGISGAISAMLFGVVAYVIVKLGLKEKDRTQIASDRKNEIYIPLKYKLISLAELSDDSIWETIRPELLEDISTKNDEYVLENSIWEKCNSIYLKIREFNSHILTLIARDEILKQFEKQYTEVCGRIKHKEMRLSQGEYVEIEVYNEVYSDLQSIITKKEFLKQLFDYADMQDPYLSSIIVRDLAEVIGSVMRKNGEGDRKFEGVKASEYIARKIDLSNFMNTNANVLRKKELLDQIADEATQLIEDVEQRISSIGKKYEHE